MPIAKISVSLEIQGTGNPRDGFLHLPLNLYLSRKKTSVYMRLATGLAYSFNEVAF